MTDNMLDFEAVASRQNDWTDKLHHLGRDIKARKQNIEIALFTDAMTNKNVFVENQLKCPSPPLKG